MHRYTYIMYIYIHIHIHRYTQILICISIDQHLTNPPTLPPRLTPGAASLDQGTAGGGPAQAAADLCHLRRAGYTGGAGLVEECSEQSPEQVFSHRGKCRFFFSWLNTYGFSVMLRLNFLWRDTDFSVRLSRWFDKGPPWLIKSTGEARPLLFAKQESFVQLELQLNSQFVVKSCEKIMHWWNPIGFFQRF